MTKFEPGNRIRYLLAAVMWRLQCWGWLRWFLPYAGGRHIDWYPVRCEECGWIGPMRWCFHSYAWSGEGDTEPEDDCPRCGSNHIWEYPE